MLDDFAYPTAHQDEPFADYYRRPFTGVAGVCPVCGDPLVRPTTRMAGAWADRVRFVLGQLAKREARRKDRRGTGTSTVQVPASTTMPRTFVRTTRVHPTPIIARKDVNVPDDLVALPSVIEALDRIKELLDDPRYAWADTTLSGILDSIDFRQTVTAGQWKAVMNIVNAVERQQAERRGDRGSSRRYEGFDRKGR